MYDSIKNNTNPINYYSPYYQYNYSLIYLQEISSSEYKYATISNNKLKYKNNELNKNYLLLKKVNIDGYNAFYILDPNNQKFTLTIKDNYLSNLNDNLVFEPINNKRKQYQTFIIEQPLKIDSQYSINDQVSISIRSVLNNEIPLYLTTYKNNIVLKKVKTVKPELMTFNSEIKPAKFTSELTNLLYGSVKVYENGFVGISKSKPSKIEFIYDTSDKPTNDLGKNINKTNIFMKYNNNYLCISDNKLKLSGDVKCKMTIEVNGDNYFIKSNNKYLVATKEGILEFKEDQPIIQEEERDEKGFIVKHKRVGPKLGSEMYYKIKSSIKL